MAGLTNAEMVKVIDHETGRTGMGSTSARYLALFSSAPSDTGGGTEITGANYARVTTAGADWASASGTPPQAASAVDFSFPVANADYPAPVVAIGAYDAAGGGNLKWWAWLGNYDYVPCNIDATDLTGNAIHSAGHGLAAGDTIIFTELLGGTLPTGLTRDQLYYVLSGSLAADSFTVSNSKGGGAVDITGKGACNFRKVASVTILNGDTPKILAGQIILRP